MECSFSSKAI
jgi:hypothetical protein